MIVASLASAGVVGSVLVEIWLFSRVLVDARGFLSGLAAISTNASGCCLAFKVSLTGNASGLPRLLLKSWGLGGGIR